MVKLFLYSIYCLELLQSKNFEFILIDKHLLAFGEGWRGCLLLTLFGDNAMDLQDNIFECVRILFVSLEACHQS